jgi:hypothetical protein
MVNLYKHGNQLSGSNKSQLRGYKLFKDYSAPRTDRVAEVQEVSLIRTNRGKGRSNLVKFRIVEYSYIYVF